MDEIERWLSAEMVKRVIFTALTRERNAEQRCHLLLQSEHTTLTHTQSPSPLIIHDFGLFDL